jgi:phosphoglycolate phosphatase
VVERNLKLLVFDWDGTLIDSTGTIVRTAQIVIAELGLPERSDRRIREIIGLGLKESWESLYPDHGNANFELFVASYRRHFFASGQQQSELYPGIVEMLDQLRGMGYLLAVATGKSRFGLDRDMERTGMASNFDFSRTCDEAKSKPDPLMLHQIMASLCIEASDTLMVGDTDYDLQMASAAGTEAVAALWGAHGRDRLERHKPRACFENLCELPDWLIAYDRLAG